MADRYWVGGTGNWDATSTTNWATSSGGAGGASAPTSADNVIFDAASNTGTNAFTVTVTGDSTSPSVCNDFSTGGAGGALDGVMTLSMGTTAVLDIYGSLTLPATNFTWTGSGTSVVDNHSRVNFKATTTGKTVTTNGVDIVTTEFIFNGAGGGWTLGSAYTRSGTSMQDFTIENGTFSTGNYTMTIAGIASQILGTTNSNSRTITLGSSTITITGGSGAVSMLSTTNLTLNANTSQITCSGASPTFSGGGLTYYNVSFTSTGSGTTTINGANTFNNLTQTSRGTGGLRNVDLGANQTISGALTLGAANTSIRRIVVSSDTLGTQRTITCNGTLAAIADVDFRDINAAGTVATPWTGTRIGNCLNNSNITFTTAADKYWNLAAGGNWSATGWALSSGGAVAANNFPLAQDKVIIENTGLNTSATLTINNDWQIGELDISTRTNAMTLASSTNQPTFYKNITLSSAVTMTGTVQWIMSGQGTTQILDTNTATFVPPIIIESPSGTLQLAENTTFSSNVNLISGTLDLNDFDLTAQRITSDNSNTRTIDFGTGEINLTGNALTILNMTTTTNFTYTGTPTINCTYSGSTGTRTLSFGAATESNVLNINITAGTDSFSSGASRFKNIDFTGFAGTFTNSSRVIYGNLTISSGMTLTAGTLTTTFAATSGTQTITSNGKTLDFPVTFNGLGGTREMADALTIGSTKLLFLLAGTVKFKNGTTNSAGNIAIAGTVSNQVVIQSTSAGNTYTLSATSGPVNAYYATITDCIASPITLGTQLLGNMAYSGLSFSVNSQDTNPLGVFFKSDGTKMYINGNNNASVFQYSLSKPWNPSTATYASQDSMEAIFFKDDGTKMYLIGNTNDVVYQYSLSSAWNLATASYDSVSFSVAGQYTDIRSLFFKPDGTKMYVTGTSSTLISQYSLATPWNLSTASFDNITFDTASQDTNITGITFTSNGTTMILMGSANDTLYQYTLSTPWNISTATYDSLSFYVLNISSSSFPRQIYLKESSYILYFLEATSDSVYQLNLGNQFNAFRGAGNIYSYGNINGGNNKGINFTPPGTQLIPFF
jgi:lipopolysaccharide export system protein LptA